MRRWLGAAVAVLSVGVAGCAPSSSGGAGSCAWAYQPDPTATPAYPDTSATYFQVPFALGPGQSLVLSGAFPDVRYFSFTTYGTDGAVIDSRADAEIAPDSGSVNPFATVTGAGTSRRFTLTVSTDVTAAGGSTSSANRLSVGAGPLAVGILLLRVYLPTDPAWLADPGALPSVELRSADGSSSTLPRCAPNPGGSALAGLSDIAAQLSAPTPAPATPRFHRESGAGLFPNPDNAYLATRTSWTSGRVIVVTGRAPSFPDTGVGVSPAQPTDVRYWSMCTNTEVLPFPVVACAPDTETSVAADGTYTYVVSAPADRPTATTAVDGVTWLSWGRTDATGVLIFRTMLPGAGFGQAVQNVPIGDEPVATMGAFAPSAKYCTTTTYAALGPKDC